MMDDITQLVNETFHHTANHPGQVSLKDKSGLIYRVDSSGKTFVIRMIYSKDLEQTFNELLEAPENFPTLKMGDSPQELSEINHFECSLTQAKFLKSLFVGRRLPLFEEEVLNVSDPGYSLWLKEREGIEIFFKLSQIDRSPDLIKLGPVVHIDDFTQLLRRSRSEFERFFDIQELAVTPNSFKLKAMRTACFEDFISLLKKGKTTPPLDPILESDVIGPIFKDFAIARKFWLQVNRELESGLSFE